MVTRKVQKQTLKITIFVNYLKKQSVTYHFYFLVGKLSKFFKFKDSMTKSYLADFKIQRKRYFIVSLWLTENCTGLLSPKLLDRNAIINDACKIR